MNRRFYILSLSIVAVLFAACRTDEVLVDMEKIYVAEPEYTDVEGFYLLNEGNMGSNKSTLDYFDYGEGTYYKNIYSERNPSVVKELGDVGNDLLIYGSKPNCRYAVGDKGYVYVSSYVAPVQEDINAPKGAVFKVDTLSMQIVGSVEVGYQPEEMTVVGDRLYVANSGGYRKPNYDNTISVIDLPTFQLCDVIVLDGTANFHRLVHDSKGRLWVSSRGNYYGDLKSDFFVVDPRSKTIVKDLKIPVSNVWVDDNVAYVISTEWSYVTGENRVTYAKIDMATMEVLDRNFIKDGTDASIKHPYGIAVNPVTKDIYVTDAKSYVVSGTVYCFSKDGVLKWKQTAGQIPAHFAFKGKIKQ